MTEKNVTGNFMPAVVDIKSQKCVPGEADAEVTAVITITVVKDKESVEGDPTVEVGGVAASVVERSDSPEDHPTNSTLEIYTYDATATVDCDETYQITAEANISTMVSATPVSVPCGPCEEEEGGCDK